ncbi:hypothetical protein A9P82_01280 [Arachidicoccus ginsenosidimutans]|nr:hypothetical protein A9P82_01280 [Arachidicoccus sp. BS20]
MALLITSCSNKDDTLKPPAGSTGKYDFSSVDQYLVDNLPAYNNHVAVLVMQDGQLIYKQQLGLRADRKLPIASASKWLSGAVIMSLVDEGKLSLDDTVGKYLPIFTQYHKGNITIRQLFSHTAGFEGDIGADDLSSKYEYRKDLSLEQVVDSIAVYEPLINAPGAAFNYGSTSMQIGGRIAEIVSGKSWQELFNEKIGIPCDMQADYRKMSTENPLLAGGVATTANDYIHFLEMIVNKGMYNNNRVLSENAVNLMEQDETHGAEIQTTPYPSNPLTSPQVSPVRYGIGNWMDVLDSAGNVVETSSPGLFGTHPWQDSKHHIAGIIFTFTTPKKSNAVSLEIRKMIRDIVDKNE